MFKIVDQFSISIIALGQGKEDGKQVLVWETAKHHTMCKIVCHAFIRSVYIRTCCLVRKSQLLISVSDNNLFHVHTVWKEISDFSS